MLSGSCGEDEMRLKENVTKERFELLFGLQISCSEENRQRKDCLDFSISQTERYCQCWSMIRKTMIVSIIDQRSLRKHENILEPSHICKENEWIRNKWGQIRRNNRANIPYSFCYTRPRKELRRGSVHRKCRLCGMNRGKRLRMNRYISSNNQSNFAYSLLPSLVQNKAKEKKVLPRDLLSPELPVSTVLTQNGPLL